jgi:hypothetical protein
MFELKAETRGFLQRPDSSGTLKSKNVQVNFKKNFLKF